MRSFHRGSTVTTTGGVWGAWPFAATLLLLFALGCGRSTQSGQGQGPSCPAPTNNQGEFATPNTLYYLGDTYSGPTVVALSGEELVWAWGGGGHVVVAPKNGCGSPVELAQAHNDIGDLEATNEAAYWLGGGRLQRIPKAGGEIETVTSLPYGDSAGLLVSETLTAPESLASSSGDSYLYLHEGTLYCSAWQRIFRVVDWDHLEVLYSAGTWLFGFHYMSGLGYFLNRIDSSNMQVWAFDGSTATLRQEMVFSLVSDPLVDEEHQRLWFADSGGIGYYSPQGNAYHVVAKNGGCAYDTYASDGTFLYWGRGQGLRIKHGTVSSTYTRGLR